MPLATGRTAELVELAGGRVFAPLGGGALRLEPVDAGAQSNP
jgi:hypothetical protein